MDYKNLCLELFGTAGEAELRQIAEKLKKNSRNAGRPRKLTNEDVTEIKHMLADGVSMSKIAEKYNTSVQLIGKYAANPIHQGCPLRLEYIHGNKICSIIDVNFIDKKVYVENRTSEVLHRAFGCKEKPDWEDFEYFIKDRCFPETRGDIKSILERHGIGYYDELAILEKFSAKTADDNMKIKFIYAK